MTLAEAARAGRRLAATRCGAGARQGVIPDYRGRWTRAAAAHARIVARLREQGHSLEEIKEAGEDGRLAFGYVDELFPPRRGTYTLEQAAAETGLEAALIERLWRGDGLPGLDAGPPRRGGPRGAALHGGGAGGRLPAGRLPAGAERLRPVAAPARRRRGAAVPPLRARAADPRRRALDGDGGGAGRPDRRAAAADHAADGLPAPQLPASLRRAGRDREHGVGARATSATPSASCGSRSPSRTSSASCASRRRRASRRRSTWWRPSSARSRNRCRAARGS